MILRRTITLLTSLITSLELTIVTLVVADVKLDVSHLETHEDADDVSDLGVAAFFGLGALAVPPLAAALVPLGHLAQQTVAELLVVRFAAGAEDVVPVDCFPEVHGRKSALHHVCQDGSLHCFNYLPRIHVHFALLQYVEGYVYVRVVLVSVHQSVCALRQADPVQDVKSRRRISIF